MVEQPTTPPSKFTKISFFDAIGSNKIKSVILVFLMVLLFFVLISLFSYIFDAGIFGIVFGIAILACYTGVSYFAGDKVILSISRAKKAEKKEYLYLFNTVDGLAAAAQIPVPEIYIIDDPAPNAFATGRDPRHASLAVTSGLLKEMNRQELEGVIAHEISHIANYDVRFVMLAIVFAGVIALLSDFVWRSMYFGGRSERKGGSGLIVLAIIMAILAPIFSELIRFAISRQREFLADANGARMTRYPEGLASALEKISKINKPVSAATESTAPLYFSRPLTRNLGFLFSTHPPIEERVKRLRGMY